MKRIAVLTSGGDAPGMNACIRAVARRGAERGLEVVGVRHGYAGLMAGELVPLPPRAVGNIIQRGGTILGSARTSDFMTEVGRTAAITTLDGAGVDGLVCCGGDGTLRGARFLSDGWRGGVVGVPTSIDNDIAGTDTTVGFDTAVNTALEAIDRIRDTAEAQGRTFLVEVMGRRCGAIAIDVALAGGAVAVMVPESADDLGRVVDALQRAEAAERVSSIVIVAEGEVAGGAMRVAERLRERTGIELRVTVLGHIQRGGAPTAASRVLGTRMSIAAVDALVDGETALMVGVQGGQIVRVPLRNVTTRQHTDGVNLIGLIESLAR